jgi:LmbE family N-acetylglucosaminyl deacetylase
VSSGRGYRARVGTAVDAGLLGLWRAGFTGLARLRPTHPRLWSPTGGARVLVVAPHPDDEVAGCAGTLRRHRLAGDAVTLAVVTDGRRSRAGGLAPGEMAATRRREAEDVAARLDLDLIWLGLREGEWAKDALQAGLRTFLEASAPAIVYAPSVVDFHPEHVAVARALASVLVAGSPLRMRVYPIQVPLGPGLANLVSPVGALEPELAQAMAAYASQAVSLRPCLRARAYAGARHGLGECAEEFWELSGDDYRRLHAASDATPSPFRGLRGHALTDPLAYVRGRGERRRLSDRARHGEP